MRIPAAALLALLGSACTTAAPPAPDAALDALAPDAAPAADAAPEALAPDAVTVDAPRPRTACELATAPSLETVAMLDSGRYSPLVEVLASGSVLLAGGYDFTAGADDSAQLFDPAGGALTYTGSMQIARNFPASARLRDGTVLLAGGFHQTMGSLREAEVYDPVTATFTATAGQLSFPREAHTATLLPDGTVFLAGGLTARGFHFYRSAETYDPATRRFTPVAATMTALRAFHAAVYLPSRGEVLLVGGDSGMGELASAERYLPSTGQFQPTANARTHAGKAVAAVLLADGRVLVAGGANATDNTLVAADLYDPATDRFTPAAPMNTRRMAHSLTLLADGRVLAVGGWSDSSTPSASASTLEIYDPRTDRWRLLPFTLAAARQDHRAVLMPDCRVLIVGGERAMGTAPPSAPLELEVLTVPAAW